MTSSDIDGSSTVHDLKSLKLLDTLPLPPRISELGGKPHDLTVSGYFIFITYLGTSDGNGYVASFIRTGGKYHLFRILETKADPHVCSNLRGSFVRSPGLSRQVPELGQGDSAVAVLRRKCLLHGPGHD